MQRAGRFPLDFVVTLAFAKVTVAPYETTLLDCFRYVLLDRWSLSASLSAGRWQVRRSSNEERCSRGRCVVATRFLCSHRFWRSRSISWVVTVRKVVAKSLREVAQSCGEAVRSYGLREWLSGR